MFTEARLLPISALQHLLFCKRQCALIHIERLWAENRLTVEGGQLHQRVHDEGGEFGAGVRIARAAPLRSFTLGLYGKADVVEFHSVDERGRPRDPPTPFPVEYKRGRPKKHDADRVQLCAQAMCLEEMLGTPVPRGAIFYARTRRREAVKFTTALRDNVRATVASLHELVAAGVTPRAKKEKKCDRCSMLQLCLPGTTGANRSAVGYVARSINEILDGQ